MHYCCGCNAVVIPNLNDSAELYQIQETMHPPQNPVPTLGQSNDYNQVYNPEKPG